MELIERILRQNPWWQGKEKEDLKNLKTRELFKEILKYIKDKQIISVVGLRRVGKTTLMYQLIVHLMKEVEAKRILYFSFDEIMGKEPLIIEKVLEVYEEEILKDELKDVFVFFDEINHIKDWQVVLKRYYDLGKIKFFVSGSSSIFLKKAKESLAGRIYELELKPLSFNEYLYFKGVNDDITINRLAIKKEINNYLLNGAFPEIIEEKNFEKITNYVKSIIEKIIFYDIPRVYDIAEPEILKQIFETIARNPGSLTEYRNLASTFKITYQTVSKYIHYLEKAFLVKLLYNYTGSYIARTRKSKKIYLTTPTLSLAFISESEFFPLLPKLVENLVVVYLNAKFFLREYYEVDIVHNNMPIEVKYREKPEIKGAVEISKKVKSKELMIITKDMEENKKVDKINLNYIPLWKFLLTY